MLVNRTLTYTGLGLEVKEEDIVTVAILFPFESCTTLKTRLGKTLSKVWFLYIKN